VPADSATAELIKEADSGLAVDVSDPRAIAAAWVRLAKDGDLRRQFAHNGRLAIEQRYGWHNMEKVLEEVYSQVAVPH